MLFTFTYYSLSTTIFLQHLLRQRHIPCPHLFCCRSVTAGEMVRPAVMLQEERFKVRQRVLFTKQSPDAVFTVWTASVKLYLLQFCKLPYQCFVNDKMLLAIHARRLILMLADALTQKLRHLEIWIAEQGRKSHGGSNHLRIECSATVAYQHVGPFVFYHFSD